VFSTSEICILVSFVCYLIAKIDVMLRSREKDRTVCAVSLRTNGEVVVMH